jgi:outer membrane protein assembly factor BamB
MGENNMKRIRMTMALAAMLLVAQFATAQMMGGGSGHHGGSSGGNNGGMNGGMNGGNNGGMNGGDMMGSMGTAMGQSLVVGTDGVLYTLRASAASTTQVPAADVVAIRPTGTQAWSTKVEGRMTRLELTGTLVLVAPGSGDMGMDGSFNDDADQSRLVALSAASGSVQWTVDLEGHVASFEPFSGGVYALLMRHDGTNSGNGMHNGSNGTTLMKRSIAAIDNAGKVLWTIDLN